MSHLRAEPDVVVDLGPAERLKRLARRPLQPRREVLLALAARLRALETLDLGVDDPQLRLKDAA